MGANCENQSWSLLLAFGMVETGGSYICFFKEKFTIFRPCITSDSTAAFSGAQQIGTGWLGKGVNDFSRTDYLAQHFTQKVLSSQCPLGSIQMRHNYSPLGIFFFFFFLLFDHMVLSMQDLRSMARDQTCAPWNGSTVS